MKTEKEKMLLGKLYNGRDQELIKERKKTKQLFYTPKKFLRNLSEKTRKTYTYIQERNQKPETRNLQHHTW
jgi:hypothetical protein